MSMTDSPSKRRKTSPTTSIPVNVTETPSRIPVLRQDGARTLPGRPSFASPTRASLARHNPQLLNRPSSSGGGLERPPSRGKNLQDVFGKALGETRPVVQGQAAFMVEDGTASSSTTEENVPATEVLQEAMTAQQRIRAVGGGLAGKPRRISRSPAKSASKHVARPIPDVPDLDGIQNPFQRKGLRRSPVSSQGGATQSNPQLDLEENQVANPFRKAGLRRSPVSLQQVQNPAPRVSQLEMPDASTTTPPGPPPPSQAIHQVQLNEVRAQGNDVTAPEIPEVLPAFLYEPKGLVEAQNTGTAISERSGGKRLSMAPSRPSNSTENEIRALPVSKRHSQSQLSEALNLAKAGASRTEEPELPPTPTQRGIADPVVTTPPSGIHDTPSRRARRRKSRMANIKSSPLKPKDPPQQEPVPVVNTETISKPERRKSARFLELEDPHAAKKKQRDGLLRELQQLQSDVALANQENERIRSLKSLRKNTAPTMRTANEIAALLVRATAPDTTLLQKAQPASVFKSISSFLPFHSRRKANQFLAPSFDKPLPSHLPIELEDPLPYLQAFTPLTYTSTITLMPPDHDPSEIASQEYSRAAFQQHIISASHPSGLFRSRLLMVVDTSDFSISALEVAKLDISAEKELGNYIRKRANAEGPLGKDLSSICWAMGRWAEVSISRARFWCAVEDEFGTAEARVKSLQRVNDRRKKRKRQATVAEEGDDESLAHEAEKVAVKGKWTRRQLMSNMGRTNLEITDEKVQIRVEWVIGFDWTGEAESSITADASVPPSWEAADERNSLGKIPDTFRRLVKEEGPLGAVRAIAGLLMSES